MLGFDINFVVDSKVAFNILLDTIDVGVLNVCEFLTCLSNFNN